MPIRTIVGRRRPSATHLERPRSGPILIVAAGVVLTACSPDGGGSAPARASQATSGATGSGPVSAPGDLATQQVDGSGIVLTTAEGQVLYLFLPTTSAASPAPTSCALAC